METTALTPKDFYYQHFLITLPNGEKVKPVRRDVDEAYLELFANNKLNKLFDKKKSKYRKSFKDLIVFGQAKLLILIFCFLASITFAQPPTGKTKKLSSNEIVLSEAIKCTGKRINGGVCNEFVTYCLTKSDRNWREKVRYGKNKIFKNKLKYTYGKERKSGFAEPGDVILFWRVSNEKYEMTEHVAIIKEIVTDHSIMILDQNSDERTGKNSKVGEWIFDFNEWQIDGFVKIYQPY